MQCWLPFKVWTKEQGSEMLVLSVCSSVVACVIASNGCLLGSPRFFCGLLNHLLFTHECLSTLKLHALKYDLCGRVKVCSRFLLFLGSSFCLFSTLCSYLSAWLIWVLGKKKEFCCENSTAKGRGIKTHFLGIWLMSDATIVWTLHTVTGCLGTDSNCHDRAGFGFRSHRQCTVWMKWGGQVKLQRWRRRMSEL